MSVDQRPERYRIVLDCGHVIPLTGTLQRESVKPGREVYCGVCRVNRRLVEYGPTED